MLGQIYFHLSQLGILHVLLLWPAWPFEMEVVVFGGKGAGQI